MKARRTKPKEPLFTGPSVVRDFRIRNGHAQRDIACAVGLTPNDINRMERGHNLMLSKYKLVAEHFGVSMDAIIRESVLEKYRQEKGITFYELALRLGNTTREAGRKACAREKALGKHIRAVAAYEGLSVEEFLIRFGGAE